MPPVDYPYCGMMVLNEQEIRTQMKAKADAFVAGESDELVEVVVVGAAENDVVVVGVWDAGSCGWT